MYVLVAGAEALWGGLSLDSSVQTTIETIQELRQLLSVEHIDLNIDPENLLYKEVRRHRIKYYQKHAPHLLHSKEQMKECSIDKVSKILVCVCRGKILASLRLTARPFELEENYQQHFDFSIYKNYLEVGRLVTDPDLDQIQLVLLVRYLLSVAGLKAFTELGAEGLIAICRPFRYSLFSKFGMHKCSEVYSNLRKIHYFLLVGSKSEILSTAAEMQKNEEKLRTRLLKTHSKNQKMETLNAKHPDTLAI